MALDKTTLKEAIEDLLTDMESRDEDAKSEFATRLSNAIDAFVKSGTVNVTVATTGTASAQTGNGTGGCELKRFLIPQKSPVHGSDTGRCKTINVKQR